jgi:hypothetical protein
VVKSREQIATCPASDAEIMCSPTFALGVNDARAGRSLHHDFDVWDTNAQWNYERGRHWAKLAPRHMPLRISGTLSTEALMFFRQCGETIL